ncbi:hypothetical protein [Flaviaesturariibacter amylovorans]|uniref:Uncharacterized protein n=1 Tax=Flaviaesturariibacter amylovorans TaxID=1084520 RepID=A0ABP8GME0_9BACT
MAARRFGYIRTEVDQAWAPVRYLLFYAAIVVILSLCSSLADLLLRGAAGTEPPPGGGLAEYLLYYVIIGYPLFLLSLPYNFAVNRWKPGPAVRYTLTVLLLLFAGYCIERRFHFGFYIGKERPLKNFCVLLLAGILVEALRDAVLRVRYPHR